MVLWICLELCFKLLKQFSSLQGVMVTVTRQLTASTQQVPVEFVPEEWI